MTDPSIAPLFDPFAAQARRFLPEIADAGEVGIPLAESRRAFARLAPETPYARCGAGGEPQRLAPRYPDESRSGEGSDG